MDIEQTINDIQPLQGEVVPIRTIQETQPPEEFGMFALRRGSALSHATST